MKFLLPVILLATTAFAAPENLLRNGSFEGGTLYWHQIDPKNDTLVREAKVGEFALRIANGNVMSAPFVAVRGEPMTVSFFVKGEKPGRVGVQMPPSAREPGTKAHRLWQREAEQTAEITTEWQRVAFTWKADVPPDGFWPNPYYLVQIGGYDQPILIDGVTVTLGKEGTPDYVPRREIEVVAECVNLPGWDGAAGNAFDKGATAQMVAHVSNQSKMEEKFRIRWQLFDYEGEKPAGPMMEKEIAVPSGKTVSETVPLKLTATGCVLARVEVHYAALSKVEHRTSFVDSSEIPLTSLPYPKAAVQPDFRERFGGSFAGREMMLQKYQRLGFGWTRWFPETKWQFFQKKKGDDFNWHDADFDLAARYGVAQHVVLYGWPEGLMDKEHSGQPLPLDMQWNADDAKWDDLKLETAWDKFVKAAALHFKGRSIIFEIENEPEFDHWDKFKTEYAKFTIRTARLLRATDPAAKIMVNNVYGIPSGLNAEFFKFGGLQHIDAVSWHDYHEGWLSDAQGIRRMRQNMDEAGGKNVELWFNEGWAYTNTAVDEPIACTHLTAAQSTNAIADSVAEMSVAGQKKTILFHTGYEDHGQSFWDYSGPGTLLWDWYGYPLPLVAMWNVLNHHLGLSDEVGFVRPPGANLAIFQDLRNGRGVIVAYADREAKQDVGLEIPVGGLIVEDIMGNLVQRLPNILEGGGGTPPRTAPVKLTLAKTGRPVLLYTAGKTPGKDFLAALAPLDRKHASFITAAPGAAPSFRLPPTWDGAEKGSAAGNPIAANGQPVWRLDRLFPADANIAANYSPLVWGNGLWIAPDHSQGGHPSARVADGKINFGTLGPWGGGGNDYPKIPALAFIAPKTGVYKIAGTANSKPWDGGAKTVPLSLRKKDTQRAAEITVIQLPRDGTPVPFTAEVELTAGHELLFVPLMHGLENNATNLSIEDLVVAAK